MYQRRVRGRIISLLAIGILVMAFFTSVVAAADQVILNWEQDAGGNTLASGQVIDDEYHSTTGISVTVQVQSPSGVAAIFPSNAPPGVDFDIGSPNETCPGGGPGTGDGGEVGQVGENCMNHGNVLIMPTIGDGNGDDFIDGVPNDDDRGGTITFIFSAPVRIDYVEALDQESEENLTIESYSDVAGTNLLDAQNPSGYGDNSYENVPIQVEGVRRVELDFLGSGAISNLAFTPQDPTAVSLSSIDASAIAPTDILVIAALLAFVTVAGLWLVRARAHASATHGPSPEN